MLSFSNALSLVSFRLSVALGAFFDAGQLVSPVTLEPAGPFMERPDPISVRSIENLSAVAPRLDQADVSKHPEVFGHGWLGQAKRLPE